MKPLHSLTLAMFFLQSCAHQPATLYGNLGGEAGIKNITDAFVAEIEKSPEIFPYFAESDVERFAQQFGSHLCEITGGPCVYTGDDMQRVHDGMAITERDFNTVVDLLINAMDETKIPHRVQNEVLHRLAPLRKDITYR